MNRAPFVAALVLVSCGQVPDGGGSQSEALSASTARIRLVAANLSSGNNQTYDPGEGIRILQGLHPDVVMVQEFNYTSGVQAMANLVICGSNPAPAGCTAYVYTDQGAQSWSYQIPNGILSRYPIVSSGDWLVTAWGGGAPNRGYAWACIDIPGATDLCAISVHLNTNQYAQEGTDLVNYVNAAGWSQKYVVLGGDFNSSSRTTATVTNLSADFVTTGPFEADQNGNSNTNSTRAKPYDWVITNSALDALKTSATIGTSTYAAGAVIDTRVYSPLSDISPAVSTDSGATNMQHMAVVRDFLVPTDGTTGGGSITVTSPNGGESWTTGTVHNVTWTAAGVSTFKVEYSANGGSTWSTLTSSATGSSYAWTVPSGATTNALVRVSDASNAATVDTSNAAFTVITPPPPSGDGFEPDDSAGAAKAITPGVAQQHDLQPSSDQDWVTFTLTATTNVRIETTGPTGGDTFLRLYNGAQTELANDDDSGVGYYSLIRKPSLPAGTYYVKVTSYLGHSTILGYSLKVSSY